MSITWTEDADSRQNVGPAGIEQVNVGTFGASDYVTGGYPIFPSAFGMSSIRGMAVVGFGAFGTDNPGGYEWQFLAPSGPPSNVNPWYLKALQQNGTTGPLAETASNTNFSGGTIRVMAFGF